MLQSGYLIALSLEHAKTIFTKKDHKSLEAFVDGLLSDSQVKAEGHLLDCGTDWEQVQLTLNNVADGSPLSQTMLGGRRLDHGGGRSVLLVRPDLVRIVAAALAEINQAALGEGNNNFDGSLHTLLPACLHHVIPAFACRVS